jgi:hypothetical protein
VCFGRGAVSAAELLALESMVSLFGSGCVLVGFSSMAALFVACLVRASINGIETLQSRKVKLRLDAMKGVV